MTLKDEFLILWIFCVVLITFAVRHFFGGTAYLAERLAAFSLSYMPVLLHLFVKHLP
ncbi:MAG TPA: hypothetical protein VKP61_09730 [Candidatus Acidoferrum sp.]|nr:hypothetical protein [Candidatus Acidoferrum sp.]